MKQFILATTHIERRLVAIGVRAIRRIEKYIDPEDPNERPDGSIVFMAAGRQLHVVEDIASLVAQVDGVDAAPEKRDFKNNPPLKPEPREHTVRNDPMPIPWRHELRAGLWKVIDANGTPILAISSTIPYGNVVAQEIASPPVSERIRAALGLP